jgi:glucose-6-phosphate dehydrogenase assembly protein OpcA
LSSIIKPEQIESKLMSKWEELAKENKVRACLFNLIVFNRFSERTDYFRTIVQKVVDKFPCRVLFISEDPASKKDEIKVAVDVILQGPETACDLIDFGVSGSEIDRIPFVLLPHILPDLPVTLLWSENPSTSHALLDPLLKLADRVIFDSELIGNLLTYSKTILSIKQSYKIDVADLNWARCEGWRDLIANLFNSDERIAELRAIKSLDITHNGSDQGQSLFLTAWLSARMKWKLKTKQENLYQFGATTVRIQAATWPKLGPGTLIGIKLQSNLLFECERIPDRYHYVEIHISSPEHCDLPYQVLLGQTATGQSFVSEICRKGTSSHYLETLQLLRDQLC